MPFPHQILPTNGLEYDKYRVNNPNQPTNHTLEGNSLGAENGQDGMNNPGQAWSTHWEGPTKAYKPDTDSDVYLTGINPMFTNKMTRLGWMDTLQYIGQNENPSVPGMFTREMIAELPKLFMGICLLPPANLCRQYLRVIIRHKFKFAQYRSITTGGSDEQDWDVNTQVFGYANLYTGNVDPGTKTDPENEPMESDDIDE